MEPSSEPTAEAGRHTELLIMGTQNFFKKHAMGGSGQNLQARAIGASGFASGRSGGAANKDLGAAMGVGGKGLRPSTKTAASNAPGPKRV
jgi:hypothetical protein